MTDPASSGAAGAAAFKAVGGVSAVAAGGAGPAAIVVMLMTPPRSPREWGTLHYGRRLDRRARGCHPMGVQFCYEFLLGDG